MHNPIVFVDHRMASAKQFAACLVPLRPEVADRHFEILLFSKGKGDARKGRLFCGSGPGGAQIFGMEAVNSVENVRAGKLQFLCRHHDGGAVFAGHCSSPGVDPAHLFIETLSRGGVFDLVERIGEARNAGQQRGGEKESEANHISSGTNCSRYGDGVLTENPMRDNGAT